MIISSKFVWLHLPKTGGTALNHYFRELCVPDVYIDPDDVFDNKGVNVKHDSILRRQAETNWICGNRKKFITCRRLIDWILSDFFFKKQELCFNPSFELLKEGLIHMPLRCKGKINPADWWIEYFDVFNETQALKIEDIDNDLRKYVFPLLDVNTEKKVKKINSTKYNKNYKNYFSNDDIDLIYKNNPLWTEWERSIYGSAIIDNL